MLQVLQGDQKVSVHLMITIQLSGARRLFDHCTIRSLLPSVELFLKVFVLLLTIFVSVGGEGILHYCVILCKIC
jgi:hypothetical protein